MLILRAIAMPASRCSSPSMPPLLLLIFRHCHVDIDATLMPYCATMPSSCPLTLMPAIIIFRHAASGSDPNRYCYRSRPDDATCALATPAGKADNMSARCAEHTCAMRRKRAAIPSTTKSVVAHTARKRRFSQAVATLAPAAERRRHMSPPYPAPLLCATHHHPLLMPLPYARVRVRSRRAGSGAIKARRSGERA